MDRYLSDLLWKDSSDPVAPGGVITGQKQNQGTSQVIAVTQGEMMVTQAGGWGSEKWSYSGYALGLELYTWKKRNESNKK